MTKVLRHLLAIIVLPLTVTLVIPRWLALSYGVRFMTPATWGATTLVALGVAIFLAGAILAVSAVLRFFIDGDGTLAPWDPPRRFVATGPYRYVRNPMISGVSLVLCAQALILRSAVHAAWAATFVLLNMMQIPLVEEPGLRARFGEAYREYCRHVGRLIPRLTPYTPRRAVAVVPASGKSTRFGSDKRKALIGGVPMLQRVVRLLAEAGAKPVIVVDDNPDPDRGMFSTIQIGLAAAVKSGADVVLVHPADMPFVRADTIRAVIDECARTGRAVCPRHAATRGHPLAFPQGLARQLLAVEPSARLDEAFAAIGLVRHELDVDDPGVLKDIDTREDLGLGE